MWPDAVFVSAETIVGRPGCSVICNPDLGRDACTKLRILLDLLKPASLILTLDTPAFGVCLRKTLMWMLERL